jgi:hypothetical protein
MALEGPGLLLFLSFERVVPFDHDGRLPDEDLANS